MAIGTSDGSVYENDFEHAAAQHDPTLDKNRIDVYKGNPPDTKDNNVVEPAPTRDENVQTPNQLKNNLDIGKDPHNIYDEQGNIIDYDLSGRGPQAPGEPRGALESPGGINTPGKQYETNLSPEEETKFQDWKQKFAPNDSGADYDLRGAYKAGLEPDATTGHWPDTFKKPNHPTFSDQSMYAKDRPDLAGHWAEDGKTYIPPRDSSQDIKVNPWITITPEDIDRGINIGLSAGPGTMKGVKALTFDKAALAKAQELEANVTHPDEIHAATGTFRGADTQWRQEIDDSKALLKTEHFDTGLLSDSVGKTPEGGLISLKDQPKDFFGKTVKPIYLPDVLDHPELFKAYPELMHTKVARLPDYLKDVAHAAMDPISNTLSLGDKLNPNYVKSLVLHEAQHRIQDIEGFARGGNPMEFKSKELLTQEQKFNNVKTQTEQQIKEDYKISSTQLTNLKNAIRNPESLPSGLHKRLFEYTDPKLIQRLKDVVEGEDLLKQESKKQVEQYNRLMGEVEARNVQKRMYMNKWDRAFTPPRLTEDRPRFTQIQK